LVVSGRTATFVTAGAVLLLLLVRSMGGLKASPPVPVGLMSRLSAFAAALGIALYAVPRQAYVLQSHMWLVGVVAVAGPHEGAVPHEVVVRLARRGVCRSLLYSSHEEGRRDRLPASPETPVVPW
jgi:hypothetical protein